MKKKSVYAIIPLVYMSLVSFSVQASPSLSTFYNEVITRKPVGKLGQIIKQERISTPIGGAEAWRIAYISSDVEENKTISTALIVAPKGKPPLGGRPVIAWAHGTTGTAENCGPSQVISPVQSLNQYFSVEGDSWTDYGMPSVNAFIKEGYVVVATDYQGLGGGGKHQYAVAATQGRDIINSVRAVSSMKKSGAGKKAIIYGWSQGGGASIAAASLSDYIEKKGTSADNIHFLGFVALAPFDLSVLVAGNKIDKPTSDKMIKELIVNFSDNVFNFTHFAMSVWGTQAAFSNLKLNDLFTEEGIRVIDTILSNKCMHVAADTIKYLYGEQYKYLFRQEPQNSEAWVRAFLKGSIVPIKPIAPVIIYWGTKDIVLPPIMGKIYQEQMCKLGGDVGRVQLSGEQTHFSTPNAAAELYLPWIKERILEKPTLNACPKE